MNGSSGTLILLVTVGLTSVSLMSNQSLYGQGLAKTYNNQNCGLSIQYPSDWKSEEKMDDDPATVINNIVELQPNNDEGFNNVVGIELDDISSLSDKSFQGIKQFEEEGLSTVGDLSRILTSKTVQIGGYPAQKIVYTEGIAGTPENERFKKMAVVIVAFDREYKINYDTTNAVYYDKHISDFEAMLQSFKISEPTYQGIVC